MLNNIFQTRVSDDTKREKSKKLYGWNRMLCVEVYWGLYPKVWSAIACELEQSFTHTASLKHFLFLSVFSLYFPLLLHHHLKALLRSMRENTLEIIPNSSFAAIHSRCENWQRQILPNKHTNFPQFTLLFYFFYYSSKSFLQTNIYKHNIKQATNRLKHKLIMEIFCVAQKRKEERKNGKLFYFDVLMLSFLFFLHFWMNVTTLDSY